MKKILLALLLLNFMLFSAKSEIINDIKLENNIRVSKESILAFGNIKLGKDYSGGYALVKKIAFKGGLKKVRSEYAQWLINKKSPSNNAPLNNPKEDDSEKINYV